LANGEVEREREHFRVTLKKSASKEWERIETSNVSAWVRRVGWRICIANGIANLRRSLRVNGGNEKQEQVSARKRKEKGNRSEKDGKKTTDKNIARNESKRKLRIGSWNVCGFATDERKRIEVAENVREQDLDIVGIQESWEKEGAEIGDKVREYTWIGKKREGQNIKERGSGGVGFLVKEYMCDIIEVMKDTTFDESIWLRVPGERGTKDFFVGNIYMPPESKSTVNRIQQIFGEIATDVQKYKRLGEVMLVGDFNARVGKANQPNDIIGQYGEEKRNTNGVEMLKFLGNNELRTLNDRVQKPEAQWTWTRKCKDERKRSVLDYVVVEYGSSKEMEVHVCPKDIGTTDHYLIWTESQQTRTKRNRRDRKLYKWRTDKLEIEEKRQEFKEEMTRNALKFSELVKSVGRVDTERERDRAGAKIIEIWEHLVKTTASKVIGKKLIVCNKAVKWWDDEVKEAIRVRERPTQDV